MTLSRFNARPPVEVIEDIFLLRKRFDAGEAFPVPLLSLMLPNKQTLSGFLTDYKKDNRGMNNLTLELEGTGNLFFTEIPYIHAVVVHDIEKIDYLLTEITTGNQAAHHTATRLEIKTKMAEEAKRLTSFFGKPIAFGFEEENTKPGDYYFIRNLVTDITMTLLSIGESEPGKSAVADGIEKIVLRKSETLSISLEERCLRMSDTFARSYSTNLQRANLYQAIVEVL